MWNERCPYFNREKSAEGAAWPGVADERVKRCGLNPNKAVTVCWDYAQGERPPQLAFAESVEKVGTARNGYVKK